MERHVSFHNTFRVTVSLASNSLRLFCAGFMIAAPLGPVAFFVFRSVVHNRFGHALLGGAGAATADAFLGFSALLGLKWVHFFFQNYQQEWRIGGGLFVALLGVLLFKTPAQSPSFRFSGKAPLIFGTGFFLTLMNPLTFAAFIAAFSMLKIESDAPSIYSPLLLTAALFLGALSWWICLSALGLWGKKWINGAHITRINKAMSLLLILFGLGASLHALLFMGDL